VAAPNNRLVIYELPTSWARINIHGDPQVGVGTFLDVLALVDPDAEGKNPCAPAAATSASSA
jgi:pullulanase